MAWWKGTSDDNGNWEQDISELRQHLMDSDPDFARREKAIEARWAKATFNSFMETSNLLNRIAKGKITEIKD